MLDNWTKEEFFTAINKFGFDEFSSINGRIAIVDDEQLEKLYDQYIRSRVEILQQFWEWIQNV